MPITRRAVNDHQRLKRRQSLVESAWHLFQCKPYDQINIIDVAHKAGLAKGTVYLYFKTKEALFLAVQEIQLGLWFDDMEIELKAINGKGDARIIAEIVCETLNRRKELARLMAILHTILEMNIDYPTALAFKRMLLERITRLGKMLETCSPAIMTGQGIMVSMWVYTFLLGLHQMSNPTPIVRDVIANEPGMEIFAFDFCGECRAAITTLLLGLENVRNKT